MERGELAAMRCVVTAALDQRWPSPSLKRALSTYLTLIGSDLALTQTPKEASK